MEGIIFDIKGFALNDGPGIRTTVFMKGCPLRCIWRHNPEGLSAKPELYIKHTKCMHCGRCEAPCGHEDCRPYGRCLHVCPNDCVAVCGYPITADALAEKLIRDRDVYEMSGGGVTFSGGEPLMQHEFVTEVLHILADAKIPTAIETSSFAPYDTYQQTISAADFVMADIKLFSRAAHIRYTGVPNDGIKENLRSDAHTHSQRGHTPSNATASPPASKRLLSNKNCLNKKIKNFSSHAIK